MKSSTEIVFHFPDGQKVVLPHVTSYLYDAKMQNLVVLTVSGHMTLVSLMTYAERAEEIAEKIMREMTRKLEILWHPRFVISHDITSPKEISGA